MGKGILILFLVAFLSACGSGGGDSSTDSSGNSVNASAGLAHYQGLRSQAALSSQSTGDFLYYLLSLPDYFVTNNLSLDDSRITVVDNRSEEGLGHIVVRFNNYVAEDNLTYNGEIDYELIVRTESRLLVTSTINSLRVSSDSYKATVHSQYDEFTYPDLETIAVDYTINGTYTEDWGTNGSLIVDYESLAFDDHQNARTALMENIVKTINTDSNYGDVGVQQVSGKLYVSGYGYVNIALDAYGYYTLTGANQTAVTYRPVPHPQKLSLLTSWDTQSDTIYSTVTSEEVSNTPPRVNNLTLSPEEVYESTGLNLDFSEIYDEEGDVFTSEIRWYSDGVLIEGESDNYLYSNFVEKGKEITASILVTSRGETIVHSKSVTVSNYAPSFDYVSIYPYEPTTNDELQVAFAAWDADDESESLTTTLQWYVDDVLLDGETGETLAAGIAQKGQTVKVLATVSDGLESVSELVSMTIVNAKPVSELADINLVQESLTVTVDASGVYDPDGDAITFEWAEPYESYPNPVVISDSTASVIQVTLPKYGQFTLMVTVTDTSADVDEYARVFDYIDITVTAPALFDDAQVITSNETPDWWQMQDVATGDLSGDGLVDIAVVAPGFGSSNAISIARQISLGVFESTVTTFDPEVDLLDYTVGSAVAMLDVNQDDLLDVVVTSQSFGLPKLYVFYQTNNGLFSNDTAPASFTAPISAVLFRTGDFTGDGLDDLVALGYDNSIHVYPQLSAGGLGAGVAVNVPAGLIGPFGSSDLEVGDLNGDGLMDVVVGSPLVAFIQNSNGLEYAWHYNHFPTQHDGSISLSEQDTGGIGIGDVNNDGSDDIVVSYYSGLGIFRSVGGLIHFDTPTFLDGGGDAVDVADINGEGLDDIVLNHASSFGVHLQTADNELSSAERIQLGQSWSYGKQAMILTDVNSDEKVDVITLDLDQGIRVNLAK